MSEIEIYSKIEIGKDGLCKCNAATKCLIGRIGSQSRCSVQDWRDYIQSLQAEVEQLREICKSHALCEECSIRFKMPNSRYCQPCILAELP